jgi:hypothetical protein
MARKLLFIVFTNEACRRNHAFMYALSLTSEGHLVRIILDGEGTQSLRTREGSFAKLFERAHLQGIVAGACKAASGSCKGDASENVTGIARELGIPLLDSMDGHAGITTFVADGYEIVTF